MIEEVNESDIIERFSYNHDVENLYIFYISHGKVALIADMEYIGTDIDTTLETMNFDISEEYNLEDVKSAATNIRSSYAGGIQIEPYKSKMRAFLDFMQLYDGLLKRHYIISSDVLIEDLRHFRDGIAYIYVSQAISKSITPAERIAADVQEVKHGQWNAAGEIYECSACGYSFENEGYLHFFNYCPCCGARMDGDENNE